MIARIKGNLTVNSMDYADGLYYDLTPDFIRENSQNVLPFDKMTPDEQVFAKKQEFKKPTSANWLLKKGKDKVIKSEDADNK